MTSVARKLRNSGDASPSTPAPASRSEVPSTRRSRDQRSSNRTSSGTVTTEIQPLSLANPGERAATPPGDGPKISAELTVHMTRDAAGVITAVDESVVEMLGWRPGQLVGSPSTMLVHPEDQASAVEAWIAMITSPGTPRSWRGRYQTADGAWVWVQTVNRVEDPSDPIVSTSMTRVTGDQVGAEEELRAREQLLSRLSDALPVGLFQVDVAGQITFTNDRLHKIVGHVPAATIEAQMSSVVAEDRPVLSAALAKVLADQPDDDIEIRLRIKAQDKPVLSRGDRVCLLSLRSLTDSAGVVTGAVGCVSDVTDSVQLRHELEVRASVDELTSCLNRAASLELVGRITSAPNEAGEGSALIYVDLDGFKSVNDQFGHAAGDRLLVAAAVKLRGAVRDGDEIGRLGGDEFLAICPRVESPALAVRIAERIAAAMTSTVDIGPGTVELRASVGVAWTTAALDPDTFIAQADSAMYESKGMEPRRVSLFNVASGQPSPTLLQHRARTRRKSDS